MNKLFSGILIIAVLVLSGCTQDASIPNSSGNKIVPKEYRWGIYSLDLSTEKIDLIHSSEYVLSGLRLNNAGDGFVFSQKKGAETIDTSEEIFSMDISGADLVQLTENEYLDTYPAWSSNDKQIYFLSFRGKDLDIYVMNNDGNGQALKYDSGFHDGDVHTIGKKIAFTSESKIQMINDDGSNLVKLTNPPKAGEWGKAVLPFGDYDPGLSPDGSKIVFERLENDTTTHGNYNLYIINSDGSGEIKLTDNGYTQGLASWSYSGNKLVYIVSAMGNDGKYDMYMINQDGTNNRNIMPDYVAASFLVHSAIFSEDDLKIYFIGEWWS